MSDFGGGFNSGDTPSRGDSSDGNKPRRNYDEQTLLPVTIKMILNADGDPTGGNDLSLKDGRPLHMIKLVAAVRNSEVRLTNVFIDVEDGTGFAQVKVWVNEGDECSAISQLRQAASQDHAYIRIIGQIKEFDGARQIVANDIRPITSGNELTYHFLEVAHSFEKSLKMQSEVATGSVGMGYGIGNMASNNNVSNTPMPQAGGGMGMSGGGGLGGGSSLNDAVIKVIQAMGAQTDGGIHMDQITNELSPQGFAAGDVKSAINHLSNEGHIYSTIDEYHFQYAM
mmetsp:Transcript_20092/g.42247  ORF Transcript_20092/g.42247 Transcript_20092/m.42247 type:complete len:283 (-) Transcript_20092:295-1143(-)|eukprot:CAMPEP_0183709988 /NCGR_PEP_ID=MMETSP0737-20130205/5893_1 /TAXON_ID=385413 /ORGANISM="Thalassiosira miniscula, Strain CCMP1093" /LENGTH=282 /DNA_ID=CAMNT_0025938209 /DNA_START=24 /DNA_END=872 /DNA_ORIENTATION=-